MYLRTADYTMKTSCGIYEIKSDKGKISYKIFAKKEDLVLYIKNNKSKHCELMMSVFSMNKYKEFPYTQVH